MEKVAKIYYKDRVLYLEFSLNEEVVRQDINSYFSLDSKSEIKAILKETTNALIDVYVESLERKSPS